MENDTIIPKAQLIVDDGKPVPEVVDPGSELVASIDNLLQTQFPDLAQRPEVIQTIENVVREFTYSFSGPNPPPHLLVEYERVCPGWAARLLEQGERNQFARIEREREELAQTRLVIESEVGDRQTLRRIEGRGQILGFSAFCIIAVLGGMALYLGQIPVAITCFTTFALGVVGMFLTGREKKKLSPGSE